MPGWSCRALPGGQLAAAQTQKHQNHSGEVISERVSRRGHRPKLRAVRLGIVKSEPRAEVRLAKQKLLVPGSLSRTVTSVLLRRATAAARPQQATPATAPVLAVAGQTNPGHCSPRAALPCTAGGDWRPVRPAVPQSPAAPVPWQRALRPLAPAPPERLKRQPPWPPRAPWAARRPPPTRPLHLLFSKELRAVTGEASSMPHHVLPSITHTTLLPTSSSKPFKHPPPQASKDAFPSPTPTCLRPNSCASATSREQKQADF